MKYKEREKKTLTYDELLEQAKNDGLKLNNLRLKLELEIYNCITDKEGEQCERSNGRCNQQENCPKGFHKYLRAVKILKTNLGKGNKNK